MNPFRYSVDVTLKPCRCPGVITELSRHKTPDRAIEIADGYWNLYVAFFGEHLNIILLCVVDTADGHIVWRNGRRLREVDAGGKESTLFERPAG